MVIEKFESRAGDLERIIHRDLLLNHLLHERLGSVGVRKNNNREK